MEDKMALVRMGGTFQVVLGTPTLALSTQSCGTDKWGRGPVSCLGLTKLRSLSW